MHVRGHLARLKVCAEGAGQAARIKVSCWQRRHKVIAQQQAYEDEIVDCALVVIVGDAKLVFALSFEK